MSPRDEFNAKTELVISRGQAIPVTDHRYRSLLTPLDVLWTVPHGAPGNDVAAPPTGLVADEISKDIGLESLIVLSVVDRYKRLDMNRPASRSSPYRNAVRAAIATRTPQYLIDVHSFPDSYAAYSGRDIVILHTPGVTDRAFLERYALLLRLASINLGTPKIIEVQNQHQPVVHDIVAEARDLGMKPDKVALIEHNESGDTTAYGKMNAMAIKALTR